MSTTTITYFVLSRWVSRKKINGFENGRRGVFALVSGGCI